ncbi:MOSC domain-containing protein [uncultured Ilumatobacter sp.]|uniref:MOSC domain-containing protein n=1 Tax=uncultured Ilumatobacter sp. TaxID=879968 RepID=UPI00374EA1F2
MPAASPDLSGSVLAVHRSGEHTFSKQTVDAVTLLPGLGVDGDAHLGARVKHRSRVAADPNQPNLRQIHLVMSELLDEVVEAGHQVVPGQLGENVTTTGLDLVGLPVGSMLRLGDTALVALTGLRNPCKQIRSVGDGVLKMMFVDGERYGRPGEQVGRTGVMGVVVAGGLIRSGDPIEVRYPAGALTPMQKV